MKHEKKGYLPIPNLPTEATESHTFKDLHSASLLSIGQVCDADCSAVFTKQDLQIFNDKKELVLTGQRSYTDGLWNVNLSSLQPTTRPPPPSTTVKQPTANVILRYDKPKSELAAYFHATVGSPTKHALTTAINNGNFVTWPGLTTDLINKHLLPSIPTMKGHLKQEQQNLR